MIYLKLTGKIDHVNERLLFTLVGVSNADKKVLEYNYYYKEWFLWSGLDIEKGIEIKPDGTTYFQGSNKDFSAFHYVSKLNPLISTDTYIVDNTPNTKSKIVSCSYSSNWYNFGSPSTKSKLTKAIFLSSTFDSDFTLTIKEQINWKNINILTYTLPLGISNPSNDIKLKATKSYSNRIIFENSNSENISISGIELEFTPNESSPKGLS